MGYPSLSLTLHKYTCPSSVAVKNKCGLSGLKSKQHADAKFNTDISSVDGSLFSFPLSLSCNTTYRFVFVFVFTVCVVSNTVYMVCDCELKKHSHKNKTFQNMVYLTH